jgi:hypothetical protein
MARSAPLDDLVSMKSAIEEKRLKQLVKEAVGEAFQKQKGLIQAAVVDAIEDIGLVRAMEEADDKKVPREKIKQLLRRGREG